MGDNVPGDSGKTLPLEELAKDRFIIGTPEDVIRGCLDHKSLGVTHLIIRLNFPGMEQENVLKAIRLFGRAVIPALN